MGRAYTVTGIGFNFGGTTLPPSAREVVLNDASGTNEAVISMLGSQLKIDNNSDSTSGAIAIECLSGNIIIAADGGTMSQYISTGVNAIFRFLKSTGAGGTLATLDVNGNLKIAGTIGTGVTF